MLRRLANQVDNSRYPALAAQVRQSLGLALFGTDRPEQALVELRIAEELFGRAGEGENEGAALMHIAAFQVGTGVAEPLYPINHRALQKLRQYRRSEHLLDQLSRSAAMAASDDLLRSAVRLFDEYISIAAKPRDAAWGRLQRSQLLAAMGDMERARADVFTARQLVESIPRADPLRPWMEGILLGTEATVIFSNEPQKRIQALDSSTVRFGRLNFIPGVLPQLVQAAAASLEAGDLPAAMWRIEQVIDTLNVLSERRAIHSKNAVVFDSARVVVDRIVLQAIRDGRTAEALCYMDRVRVLLSSPRVPASGCDGHVDAPSGEAILEYAIVSDTLLVWVVAGQRVLLFRRPINEVDLSARVVALERKMESQAPEGEIRSLLTQLYNELVRPVERWLGPPGTPLIVIADGSIADIPFAALYDVQRERYLLQDHPIRHEVSLRTLRRVPLFSRSGRVLLVADPAFDPREHPLLDRLEGASKEVNGILEQYKFAKVLQGQYATRWALETALYNAELIHFAGHAVFDDVQPESSYLVLAPWPGTIGSGRISAAELSSMNLSHVRLVVLSACRTMRTGRSQAAGYTSLSGALLISGVQATIGTTWSVDDRWTSMLMPAFYRAYRVSGNGPRALRSAQMELITSRDPRAQSPAAWAGFRYAGR
jgi:CHAT domain-containing protein